MKCQFCKEKMDEDFYGSPFIFYCPDCEMSLYISHITISYLNEDSEEYWISIGENRTIIMKDSNLVLDVSQKLNITPQNIEEKIKQLEFYL